MPAPLNLIGNRFGRTTVINRHYRKNDTRKYPSKEYLLECDCKEKFIRRQSDLSAGFVYECPNCVFRRSEFYIGGKKFGRLNVQDKWRISEWTNGHKYREWFCICECGSKIWVAADSIRKGHTISCGCYVCKNNSRYVNASLYPSKHNLSSHFAYKLWIALVHKCHNPKSQSFSIYGANGYTCCDLWRNSASNFIKWLELHRWEKGKTIDIKAGKKEFNPMNCFLISTKELMKKNRHAAMLYTYGIPYDGKIKLLKEWCFYLKIDYSMMRARIKSGKSFEEALEMPRYGESGKWMKREEVSDAYIKKLYENGHTQEEINKLLNFNPSYRMKKMGLKKRLAIRRSAIDRDRIIHESYKNKEHCDTILEKTGYSSKSNLLRRMSMFDYTFNDMQVIVKI